jgi:hypothetical protein
MKGRWLGLEEFYVLIYMYLYVYMDVYYVHIYTNSYDSTNLADIIDKMNIKNEGGGIGVEVSICMYVILYVYICMYIYVYTCILIYTYICIFIYVIRLI